MKRFVVPGLVLGWMLVLVPQSQAFFGWFGRCAPPCPPPCAPVCAPTVCLKVEAIPVKCTVMLPRVVDVKKTINVCIPVPRVVEKDVCRVKYVPTPCVDCNGCVHMCLKPHTYIERVKCVVYDCKYEPRVVLCPTVIYEPQVVVRTVYRCVPVPCAVPLAK